MKNVFLMTYFGYSKNVILNTDVEYHLRSIGKQEN